MFQISKEALIEIVQQYWRLDAAGLNKLEQMPDLQTSLKANFQKGLVGDDFEERIRIYGDNRTPVVTFIQQMKEILMGNITRAILVIAALQTIVQISAPPSNNQIGTWMQGFAIIICVLTWCSIAAVISYVLHKSSSYDREEFLQVRALRKGEEIQIPKSQILVGDVVILQEGEEVPADGLIIFAEGLTIDESAITGESEPVQKEMLENCLEIINSKAQSSIPSPISISGSKVLSGKGLMVVLVVGESCFAKNISALEEDATSPLSHKLNKFKHSMSKVGQVFACIITITLLIRFAQQRIQQNSFSFADVGDILNFIMLGITILTVAIPGGLSFALTLALAYSTKQMLQDSVLIRKLKSVELIGSVDTICTDCTGTLTQNRLRVLSIWNQQAQDDNISSGHIEYTKYFSKESFGLFVLGAAVNGSAKLRPEREGSITQIAMLEFVERFGLDYEAVRDKYQPSMKLPFTSHRKRISIVLNNQVFMQGSSEIILQSCSAIYTNDPAKKVEKMTEAKKLEVEKVIANMASNGMRTIAVAYKNISEQTDIVSVDPNGVYEVEKSDFILIAILGIRDTLRQEVRRAVKTCKLASIKVIMMTGDSQTTARVYGKESGILIDENSIVMEGSEFIQKTGGLVGQQGRNNQSQTIQNGAAFDEIYPQLDILARCRPEDKYTLVTALQQRGRIVAVTGDGTNDAPALKKADIGIAMGIAGTEIARESADILLLDDNISSVIKAVIWSRNIQESMEKLVQFQSTAIIVSLVITLIGAVLLRQPVFQPIQLLWIKLIIDTVACLAIVTESPSEALLKRKPAGKQESIVSSTMFKHIFGQSVYQLIVLIIVIFAADSLIPEYAGDENTVLNGDNDYEHFYKAVLIPSRHFTFVVNLFVILQLFNLLNSRMIHDEINPFQRIFQNKPFIITFISIFMAQVIIVNYGGLPFHSYPFYVLSIQHWLICIAFGCGSMICNLTLKFLPDIKWFWQGKNKKQVQQKKNQ